ncbi:rop guanine nucleotide exchange factor 14 [Solanum pennellii]|uniref:Rop guanine nucleotide exchange factor 14 n=1 Tax=Solanum pennellii TaxID=28526 RepID=A0ABM1V0X7_SOLPN|nr:rop guanine nucleotide exchange factor 14 [Solanum pennellii]XP_027769395.1 rop guanine nucleotide exchange factor 14 [Solanum pennellii]
MNMMIVRRTLACCTRDKEISIDFGEQERITTYDGLESCILNSQAYDYEKANSRVDVGVADSLYDDDSSSSSSNNAFGSYSSQCTTSPQHFYVNEKSGSTQLSDVEMMKERFAKLLLGEDVTGGSKGVSSALALSNAITYLAASVFGELWKLEPLAEERKIKWRTEMDLLLSPTNHMIELVPARQSGSNGQGLEIMTPKVRADIHMNLPALRKLDSMLLETLDSMVSTEFWYTEVSSRAEGKNIKWCLPSPKVPVAGLSEVERKKLVNQGKLTNQIFKAAKAINENVLAEMPVPAVIKDALRKSSRTSLGDDLYRLLTEESTSAEEMLISLNLKSENSAVEVVNRLERSILAWKERITDQASGKSPARRSWSFVKDPISELDKVEVLLNKAESLVQQLKFEYPNLPQTFLNVTKIQYGTDIGHSILEAYSRVLLNLAHNVLTRIGEVLQVDFSSNVNSPAATVYSSPISSDETLVYRSDEQS